MSIVTVSCNSNNRSRNITPPIPTTQPQATQPTQPNCRIIDHDVGQTKICNRPQKIAILRPHNLDLLLSLGRQPAGYAELLIIHPGKSFDNPKEQIPYLGDHITTKPLNLGTANTPSLETLAQLKPDLIVGGGTVKNQYSTLSQIAPTILWSNRTVQGKWQQNLQNLAKAVGDEEKAIQVIQKHNQMVAAAKSEFAEVVASHPKILLIGGDQLSGTFYFINKQSYLSNLFNQLGFELVSIPGQENDGPSIPVSIEALPELGKQADTIIVLGYNIDIKNQNLDILAQNQAAKIQEEWRNNKIAQSLQASKNNRVFFTSFYLWNGINGPISAQMIIQELRQFLLQPQ